MFSLFLKSNFIFCFYVMELKFFFFSFYLNVLKAANIHMENLEQNIFVLSVFFVVQDVKMCFISHNAIKMQFFFSFYSFFLSLFLMNEPRLELLCLFVPFVFWRDVCLRLLKPAGVMQGNFHTNMKKDLKEWLLFDAVVCWLNEWNSNILLYYL